MRRSAAGLSNTAAVAEWVRGNGDPQVRDPKRSVFATPDRLTDQADLGRFGSECHGLDPQSAQLENLGKGLDWTRDGLGYSLYNHVLWINDHTCTNAGLVEESLAVVRRHFAGPLMAYPDSGYFEAPDWRFVDSMSPARFEEFCRRWISCGVQLIGGCCGLSVEHIRAAARARDEVGPASRG